MPTRLFSTALRLALLLVLELSLSGCPVLPDVKYVSVGRVPDGPGKRAFVCHDIESCHVSARGRHPCLLAPPWLTSFPRTGSTARSSSATPGRFRQAARQPDPPEPFSRRRNQAGPPWPGPSWRRCRPVNARRCSRSTPRSQETAGSTTPTGRAPWALVSHRACASAHPAAPRRSGGPDRARAPTHPAAPRRSGGPDGARASAHPAAPGRPGGPRCSGAERHAADAAAADARRARTARRASLPRTA